MNKLIMILATALIPCSLMAGVTTTTSTMSGTVAVTTTATINVDNKFIDGNWFSESFGSAGNTVMAELNTQLAAYQQAKSQAEADSSDVQSRKLCAELAIRSGVRAQYWAEVGRLLKVSGDKVGAIDAYNRAATYAATAQTSTYDTESDVEKAKIAQNQKEGKWIAGVAKRALENLSK